MSPVQILLLVAVLEVAINRIAVPMLRPPKGTPPEWHTLLDYAGLFLQYFTGTLAVFLIGARVVAAVTARAAGRELAAVGLLALAAALAAIQLVVPVPEVLVFVLEIAFAAAVLALPVAAIGRGRDLGAQLGGFALAVPLLVHTLDVVGAKLWWPDGVFDEPGVTVAHAGVIALCLAALASPYVFAPRPFSRAVTRPGPVLFAMTVAALGAVVARSWYGVIAKGAALAIGVELNQGQADPRLALYLLAIATLGWTLASCAVASSEARRQIGVGIGLVVLGGYAFHWPHHYLLPLLGLAYVGDAAGRVRDEELAILPLTSDTPPIADTAWSSYVTAIKAGLERVLGDVHTLTTRGDGGLASSVILGDVDGMIVRTRIERVDGSVIALDVTLGREIDEVRGATMTLWSIAPRALGINPAAPPAAPAFRTGDQAFDDRFRARGNQAAFARLLDDGLRARAVATLDGWLAYWEPEGLRYRVYPGRGAPLDHPMPLSDLALGRPATADRLVAVVELLVDIARRAVVVAPPAEPSALDEEAPAPPTEEPA